jgi:hypothetical protein
MSWCFVHYRVTVNVDFVTSVTYNRTCQGERWLQVTLVTVKLHLRFTLKYIYRAILPSPILLLSAHFPTPAHLRIRNLRETDDTLLPTAIMSPSAPTEALSSFIEHCCKITRRHWRTWPSLISVISLVPRLARNREEAQLILASLIIFSMVTLVPTMIHLDRLIDRAIINSQLDAEELSVFVRYTSMIVIGQTRAQVSLTRRLRDLVRCGDDLKKREQALERRERALICREQALDQALRQREAILRDREQALQLGKSALTDGEQAIHKFLRYSETQTSSNMKIEQGAEDRVKQRCEDESDGEKPETTVRTTPTTPTKKDITTDDIINVFQADNGPPAHSEVLVKLYLEQREQDQIEDCNEDQTDGDTEKTEATTTTPQVSPTKPADPQGTSIDTPQPIRPNPTQSEISDINSSQLTPNRSEFSDSSTAKKSEQALSPSQPDWLVDPFTHTHSDISNTSSAKQTGQDLSPSEPDWSVDPSADKQEPPTDSPQQEPSLSSSPLSRQAAVGEFMISPLRIMAILNGPASEEKTHLEQQLRGAFRAAIGNAKKSS